jgi:hypothetical protein
VAVAYKCRRWPEKFNLLRSAASLIEEETDELRMQDIAILKQNYPDNPVNPV